jgi:hypothetical protein
MSKSILRSRRLRRLRRDEIAGVDDDKAVSQQKKQVVKAAADESASVDDEAVSQ